MNETIDNIKFLKETIGKFKNEIQKFIADPNYASHNTMNLRQSVEDLEKKIINKEKLISNQILNSNRHYQEFNLPSIPNNTMNNKERSYTYNPNNYTTLKYVKKQNSNSLISDKVLSNNNFVHNSTEKEAYKLGFLSRKQAQIEYTNQDNDIIHSLIASRRQKENQKKETFNLLKKFNMQTERKENSAKRSNGNFNFMENKNKVFKYSTISKNYMFQKMIFDNDKKPLVSDEELRKGILNLILRGVIPKNADLTPAFNKEGNPLQLNANAKEIYSRNKIRDEIEQENYLDKIKYKLQEKNNSDNVFLTNMNENKVNKITMNSFRESETSSKKLISVQELTMGENHSNNMYSNEQDSNRELDQVSNHENSNEDLTLNQNESGSKHSEILSPILNENSLNEYNQNLQSNNSNAITNQINNTKETKNENLVKDILQQKQRTVLLFSNFKIVNNDEFQNFRLKNDEKWGTLNYLIEHLQKLFKKLNLAICEVDGRKLEKLANDELRNISNRDLIGVLTDKDMQNKGLDNPKKLFVNLKESFTLRIQSYFRAFLARKRVKSFKQYITKISKIQRFYRLNKLIQYSRGMAKESFRQNYIVWRQMMDEFKKRWREIKTERRIEIHINSLSYSFYKNCTVDKYLEKEVQLSRLVALTDPNVEIIYISPFHLGNEILSYYFSILQTMGVKNAKDRFHLVIPDQKDKLPAHFTLSQILLYSSKSISTIRKNIKNKIAYIVPGVVNKNDVLLSMSLECPILMDEFELTNALFSKSGSKRVFDLTGMAIPISAWDIKGEDEFFSSLAHLVINHITINIWIFKIDNENYGRGIAYIALDKIKNFVDMRNQKKFMDDEEKFEAQIKLILKKNVPKKAEIVCSKIHRNWEEFFTEYCSNRGIIEACPTNTLAGVMGSPAVSFLIEPDGNLDLICTYDKINCQFFRNAGVISPLQSIPNLVIYFY